MAKGNEIVITDVTERGGVRIEGFIGATLTPKPGTVMQLQGATARKGGRPTFEIYAPGADGDRRPMFVLDYDALQGMTATDAYAAGDRCFIYVPRAGEELNMLIKDVSGTGDDHAIGELLIVDDATGKLIATTGSPESEPFQLLETLTDPTADQLAWCMYTGY